MADFETFILQFKADTTQLKKEIDDVQKRTKDITEQFKDTEDQTKKTDSQFISLGKSLATVAAAYFSVGSVVSGFRASLAHTTGLAQLSREMNINVGTLDAWSKAVKNFGGDSGAFQNSIRSLAKTFNTSNEVALQFLLNEADVFKKLGPTQRQIYGEQLGIDPGTIAFISQGRKEIEKILARQIELGVVNEKDAQIAREFNKSIGELSDAFGKLFRSLSADILPALTDFANFLTEIVSFFTFWREENKESPVGFYSLTQSGKFSKSTPTTKPESKPPIINQQIIDNSKLPTGVTQIPLPPLPKNKSGNTSNEAEPSLKLSPLPPLSYNMPEEFNVPYQVPTTIPAVTNSQAKSLYVGDININTTAQDAKAIGKEVVEQIDQKSQFWQSNSYFDNAVVV